MKVLIIVWRDPNSNLREESFDAEEFKVEARQGWLDLKSKKDGLIRMMRADRVEVVQFGEKPDESRIVAPSPSPFPRPLPS